jgi:hypothetical protein
VFAFGLLDPEKRKAKTVRYIKEKNVSTKLFRISAFVSNTPIAVRRDSEFSIAVTSVCVMG